MTDIEDNFYNANFSKMELKILAMDKDEERKKQVVSAKGIENRVITHFLGDCFGTERKSILSNIAIPTSPPS